jgi:hypothetical protein
MVLGFATSSKLIELQDQLGVDIVQYSGDLCYAGMSGDLTPFNNVTEDDEFGHVSQHTIPHFLLVMSILF